jgi:hypothetical protein
MHALSAENNTDSYLGIYYTKPLFKPLIKAKSAKKLRHLGRKKDTRQILLERLSPDICHFVHNEISKYRRIMAFRGL